MLSLEEISRQIPPEEKLTLINRAHSAAIVNSLVFIVGCCSIAVGLKLPWLIWISLIAAPIIYQSTSSRTWRRLHPNLILNYLAARSVARRFAYAANAHDLGVKLVFRGQLERLRVQSSEEERELESALGNIEYRSRQVEVWAALLNDAVVAFTEGNSGGQLLFSSQINSVLGIESRNKDGSNQEYSQNMEVYLTSNKGTPVEKSICLTSHHPAALHVFEKQLRALRAKKIAELEARMEHLPQM